MGNRQIGGQKSSKPKEEKKREKEPVAKREKEDGKTKKKTAKKEKKENKTKKKEKAKKADGKSKQSSSRGGTQHSGSEFDSDLESSHMTGWDSESGVFHSAENISSSPYLDSHTRSELEHSGTWSSLYESSASRHPHVLSSRDFRDGFSLEACIPPEIARRDTSYHDQDCASGGGGSGSNVFSYSNSGSQKSKRSNSSKSSRSCMSPTSGRHHSDDLMSVSTSSSQKSAPAGREGFSTPLLTTPVFGRVDRSHSPISPGDVSSALARVHEADHDSMDIVSLSKSPFDPNAKVYTTYNPPAHLAHLYQRPSHTIDYRNLPKPSSPHPQRRALSPKMTSPPFKLISSDDSSSSPSTPVPQRKAGNILAELLRSGRGSGEKKKQKKSQVSATSESDDNAAGSYKFRSELAQAEEMKKSKGLSMWKTWERSSKKKSDKTSKISIFGTSRKRNKKSEPKNDAEVPSVDMETSKENRNADRMSDSTLKDLNINTAATSSAVDKVDKTGDKNNERMCKTAKSSTSSYENSSSRGASDVDYWGDKNRNSSPPVAKSAAFCIMRLEELERNIEKTIREKFPDAEPFLIRKRTPPDDSSRGSKSLPTTPSPKKKVFVSHDNTDSSQKEVTSTLRAASNKLGDVVGATRYYDETFEESASPVMSPVVLRRFGARTRHASISPKIQRAKTAALYNSPSEMERVAECTTPLSLESPPNESADRHERSTNTAVQPTISSTAALTKQNKSFQNHGHHLVRQKRIELSESEEDSPSISHYAQHKDESPQRGQKDESGKESGKGGVDTHSFDKPVIVPSFSAVFGSVSPKLKRHMQLKHGGQSVDGDHRLDNGGASRAKVIPTSHRSESVDSALLKTSRGEQRQGLNFGQAQGIHTKDTQRPKQQQQQQQLKQTTTTVTSGQDLTTSSSVRARAANIMGKVSVGRGGGGEGGGGHPSPSNARASEQVNKSESTATHSASPKPGWPNSDSHLRIADSNQHGAATGKTKESHVTSPGTGRKHSTDHVIFGSPVALPCRLYSDSTSPSSSPERRKGTNNNHEHPASNFHSVLHTHAQSDTAGVHERNVKRWQGQIDASSNTPSSTQFKHIHESVKSSSDRLVESNRDVHKENVSVSDENSRKCQREDQVTCGHVKKAVLPDSISGLNISKHSSANATRQKENAEKNNFQRDPSRAPKVAQYDKKAYEEEQPVIVLKQPVSKVISDMINSSKQRQNHQQQERQQQDRQQEQQQRLQQLQQQRNWQASPTTPEKDAMHVEPAFTMVTAPSLQQACLALETKHVVNGMSCAPSSRGATSLMGDKKVEKGEEFPTGDEVVGTLSGGNNSECVQVGAIDNRCKSGVPGSSGETSEGSDLDGFLKNVKASENLSHAKPAKEMPKQCSVDDTKQNPPPPSPTTVEKVSEILEEEEEEEEVEGREAEMTTMAAGTENEPRKEVNLALVRHNEIREFSDKVIQRLSDLLSSHTGSDEVFVGTDWREDDEEKNNEDKEDDVFMENAQIVEKSHEFRDDLKEHWEDPGLLSEISEANALEPLPKANMVTDITPAKEIRHSQFSTSSSLSTSTSSSSSSSGLFAPPALPPSGRHKAEGNAKRKVDQEYLLTHRKLHEDDIEYFDDDSRNGHHANYRCYHSDDDVARGGGIPDYYDDKPLWKKRQKPPGQISIALAATRRRERRERWLKKRRRNKTDLVSTGSSDMGSQNSLKQGSRLSFGDSTGSCEYEEDEEVANTLSSQRRAMGSGILCSPKYSKPIMPFLGSGEITRPSPPVAQEQVITQERVAPRLTASFRGGGDDADDVDDSCDRESSTLSRSTDHTLCDDHNKSLDTTDELEDHRSSLTSTEQTATTATTSTTGSHSHLAIPGLEETFDELMSVKQILEELQDRTPAPNTNVSKTDASKQSSESLNITSKSGDGKFMPLTVENIKSMKEMYKDSGGNGRRSRMSNTDRTESDLDLFSEYRDDASTDSNLYADDEEDDDLNERYATADDDVSATTGGDEVENFVVSCTFYNSNSAPLDHAKNNKNEGTGDSRSFSRTGPPCRDSETTSVSFNDSNTRNNNNNNDDNNNNVEGNHHRLVRSVGASSYGRSNSAPGSRSGGGNQFSLARGASAAGYNSDEEFWAGRAAFERSYQQLETAAGAVSSTFQNAREQMMDIQQHLQALRRQMEGLQDDLTSTSYTLTPDFSAFDSK